MIAFGAVTWMRSVPTIQNSNVDQVRKFISVLLVGVDPRTCTPPLRQVDTAAWRRS